MGRKPKRLPAGITSVDYFVGDEKRHKYRVRVQYKGRATSAGMYDTLAEAKAALTHYRHQVLVGTFIPARERHRRWNEEREDKRRHLVTVAEYGQRWLEALGTGPKARSEGTIVAYESTLNRHIIPALGDRYLSEVTQEQVDQLLELTKEKSGEGARRNVARTLRALFRHARENKVGGLESVPFKVSTPKSPLKPADDVPLPREVVAISKQMPESLKLAPLLSAVCALRPGETLGLQRQDFVGLTRGTPVLRVRRQWDQKTKPPSYTSPKQGSERDVPIPRFLVPQIQEHLEKWSAPGKDAPVFASPKDKAKPRSHNGYRHAWNEAQRRAGVGPFVMHSLRHLGLSLLSVVGATQAEAMEWGGHRDAETAARYQHSLRGRGTELTEALAARWTLEAGNE